MNAHMTKQSIPLLCLRSKQQQEPISVRRWSYVKTKSVLMNVYAHLRTDINQTQLIANHCSNRMLALVKITTNVQTTCTIVLKVCGHYFVKFFNYNSVCTNLDILDEIANPNGDPFECSCNTNYGGNAKLCDLIG